MTDTPKQPIDEPQQQNANGNQTAEPSPSAEREKHLDKTIADSFPTSDPPSTIPNPA